MAVMTAKQSVKKLAPFKRGYGRNFFVETNKILAELTAQSKETDKILAELAEQSKERFKETEKILAEFAAQTKEQSKEADRKNAEFAAQTKEQSREASKKNAELAAQSKERFKETEKILAEFAAQTKEQSKEAEKEYKKTWKIIRELSKNVGGINRTLGKWSEEMIAANICKKINPFGYKFAWCGRNLEFCRLEDGKVFAEVDCFLENGDVVMLVEIKTDLKKSDIDEHLERIKKIRQHLNNRDEKRTIVAAVAGAIVHKSVCIYAQKQGLYVFMQSGETMAVAEIPAGFTPRKWHFALEEH